MDKLINKLTENLKLAYKESILIDNKNLQDLILESLTDIKKLEEEFKIQYIENKEDNNMNSKKTRYTYDEVKAITEIQVKLAKDEISLEDAKEKISKISKKFPLHNLTQYNKHMKDRLNGIGTYGMAIPSNWAKALLEVTNNDPMVIKALKEQQKLYKEKDGRVNKTLMKLLENVEKNTKNI